MNEVRQCVLTGLIVTATLIGCFWLEQQGTLSETDKALALQLPPFVNTASAASIDVTNGPSFLEEEAGISAYMQVAGPIDLSIVRDEFRTIERETDQYIVGSVGIPDYTENYDPHVYVQADGWVVAYYLAADPTSMVIDLCHYSEVDDETQTKTMLEKAIGQILIVTGLAPSEVSYYDFRYPDATNLMLITELIELDGSIDEEGEDSFEVKLLTDFTFYERSWSHAFYATGYHYESSSTLYVNDTPLNSLSAEEEWKLPIFGTLESSELPPGVFHTVRVSVSHPHTPPTGRALTGMALTYREAPQ